MENIISKSIILSEKSPLDNLNHQENLIFISIDNLSFPLISNFNTENDCINKINSDYVKKILNNSLALLNFKDRDILQLKFGINNFQAYSLNYIGEKYNITNGKVNRLIHKALKKLKSQKDIQNLFHFL